MAGTRPHVPMRSGGSGASNARLNRSEHLGAKRNHVVGLCSPHADKREGASINKIRIFSKAFNYQLVFLEFHFEIKIGIEFCI